MVNVSVIVPVYNVEGYLSECLDSLLNQTLPDVEIICVNDGSTDRSGEILNDYARKNSNIVLINQPNQGQSAARNNAVTRAKGKYITFVDSDDFVDSNMLQKMFQVAEDNDCPLVICDCLLYWTNKTAKFNSTEKFREGVIYDKSYIYKSYLDVSINTIACCKLYKREIWLDNKIMFPTGQIYEDILLSFQVVHYYGKAMFVKDSFYKYRMRDGSSVSTPSPKKVQELVNAIVNVNDFVKCFVEPFPELNKYLMCFNISYGLYAQQLNSLLPSDVDLKDKINKDVDMDKSVLAVLCNNAIRLKLKVKYLCYKLGILYRKKRI